MIWNGSTLKHFFLKEIPLIFLCFRLQKDMRDLEEEQSILLSPHFKPWKKKNLSEITYVTNTTVLQRHQSCSWAVLKSLENRSVCQGMNFIDICSVEFNSLKDAVQTLIWWNEQPRGTAAHSPRLLTACSGACLEASRGLQWSKLLGTSVSCGHSRGVRDDRRYSKHSSALVS